MSPSAYLDASAITKLLVEEDESAAMRSYAAALDIRLTSRLALVEVLRASRRRGPSTAARAPGVLDAFDMIEIDEQVLYHAGRVDPPHVGTLDAIHLATALEMGPQCDAFVTYDQRLAEAAELAGLRVESPA